CGGQRDGSVVDPSDHGADSVSACHEAWRAPGSSWRIDDREHRGWIVSSAGRPQSLYRLQHRKNGHQRNHGRRAAVAVRHARVSRAHHLFAGNIVVATQAARHDLNTVVYPDRLHLRKAASLTKL